MTHPQEAAFVAAVIDEPGDDLHRLVFADWLDDNGDSPRAEFIRAQVTAARPDAHRGRAAVLRKRANQLLLERGAAWLAPLAGLEARHRRGFPESLAAGCRQALRHGEAWARATPFRELRLRDDRDALPREYARLAASGWFRSLDSLDLTDAPEIYRGPNARAFLAERPFANLRRLCMAEHGDGFSGEEAVADEMPNLREIVLVFREPAVGAVTVNPAFAALTRLDINATETGSTWANAVAASPTLCNLRSLSLSHDGFLEEHGIDDAGMAALAGAAHLAGLEALRVSGNEIGDAGVRALVESPHLTNLRSLNLACNRVGETAMTLLAGWEGLGRLRELDVRQEFGGWNPTPLARSPHLGAMELLRLGGRREEPEFAALARNPTLRDDCVLGLIDGFVTVAELRG